MLTQLRFQNFKAWQDTGPIRLAPITVLFGANSSGKSSISQLLLMLKQTAESPDRLRVLHAGDKRTAIDLGTYQDMVYAHEGDRLISFTIEWCPSVPINIPRRLGIPYDDKQRFSFCAEIGLRHARTEEMFVQKMFYLLTGSSSGVAKIGMERVSEDLRAYRLVASRGKFPGRRKRLPSPIHFYGFPDEVSKAVRDINFLRDLTLSFEELLQKLYYIGPLRSHPQRMYSWSGEIPGHVGWLGERTIDAILAARDRVISLGRSKQNIRFDVLIAETLKEMGLIESFKVAPIGPNRREYDVFVRTPLSAKDVNLTDIGFGISQVLPIIVQCFYAPKGSTILIEQPELHLHPAIQASLADLFIDTIHATEQNAPRGIQLIIESHSEHFLRRLQRRIAEQVILPEQTAVYFSQPGRRGATLNPLNLDSFGNITNWPKNFFGDEMSDLAAMATAAADRQIKPQES